MTFMSNDTNSNLNSKDWWNSFFTESGGWEKNTGRLQTRTFAECFNRVIDIPLSGFSLLDAGCALGDALPVFKNKYPDAKLSGCDFSETGIARCQKQFGDISSFFTASIDSLNGEWDVIYCSNVLEHFPDPVDLADKMLGHCRILYLMLPYRELNGEELLTPATMNKNGHMYSFFKDSFDGLIAKGSAKTINAFIDDCPKAWGWKLNKKIFHVLSAIRHFHNLKSIFRFPKEIIFEIHSKVINKNG